MEALSLPTHSVDTPETLHFLTESERRAYAKMAGITQPLMQLVPRTVRRLLGQVAAQQQQLLLHQRREAALVACAAAWHGMGPDFPDYLDAAQELKEVLEDPHFGDPAYQEPDMEHDGIGWRTPYPSQT